MHVIVAARPFPIPEQIAISDMDSDSNIEFLLRLKF